ncbi:hypothetical protein [Streptomyces sp. NPDC059224]
MVHGLLFFAPMAPERMPVVDIGARAVGAVWPAVGLLVPVARRRAAG